MTNYNGKEGGGWGVGQFEHPPDRFTSSGSSLAVATNFNCITGSIFNWNKDQRIFLVMCQTEEWHTRMSNVICEVKCYNTNLRTVNGNPHKPSNQQHSNINQLDVSDLRVRLICPYPPFHSPLFLFLFQLTSFLLIIQEATWPSEEIEKKFNSFDRSSSYSRKVN